MAETRPVRIAINGFGRIGRNVLRALCHQRAQGLTRDIELVAINDIGSFESIAHLTRYDTTHGRFPYPVSLQETPQATFLKIDAERIRLLNQPDPRECPWHDLEVDLVLECTGKFRAYEAAGRHLEAGAGRVIMGAVPFDPVDAVLVYGVNEREFEPQQRIISSASCTTHCLAPLLSVLDDAFGVQQAFMTEVHAYTSDQVLLDHVHRDLRRARAGAQNLIPTTSSSINAVQQVLPHLSGRIDGYSLRVPTLNVAAVDLTLVLEQPVTQVQRIHEAMRQASRGHFSGILGYCQEPLVSADFIGRTESAIYDETQTLVSADMIKVVAWYDNEIGYVHRLLDLARHIGAEPIVDTD